CRDCAASGRCAASNSCAGTKNGKRTTTCSSCRLSSGLRASCRLSNAVILAGLIMRLPVYKCFGENIVSQLSTDLINQAGFHCLQGLRGWKVSKSGKRLAERGFLIDAVGKGNIHRNGQPV